MSDLDQKVTDREKIWPKIADERGVRNDRVPEGVEGIRGVPERFHRELQRRPLPSPRSASRHASVGIG